MTDTQKVVEADKESQKVTESNYVEEEELVDGPWQRPHVDVKEVDVKSGEEDEETFWSHRAKLYRWSKKDDAVGEWKERGLGDAKLLKHKQTGKIRFLLRQEKTLKIVANHYVVQHQRLCTLTSNAGNEKIWVWTVKDFATEDCCKLEQFALKFGQPTGLFQDATITYVVFTDASEFKAKFEEAAELNRPLFKSTLELAAEESKSEEKCEEKETETSK